MNTKMMICLLMSFIILSACAPAQGTETIVPTAVPTATEKPASIAPTAALTVTEEPKSADYHPLSIRTGIAEVDAVLAAVESGDAQALRDLVRFTTIGCVKTDGMGGPPKCQDGEAEGTLVHVLPFMGIEGSFVYESDLPNLLFSDVLGIYAVYAVSESAYSEEAYPAGKYAVMFATETDQVFIVYQIREGIVRIDTVFSPSSRDAMLQRDASDLILIPK